MPSASKYDLKLFDELAEVAALLDRCCGRNRYRETLAMHRGSTRADLLRPPAQAVAFKQPGQRLLRRCAGEPLPEEMLAGELQYWDGPALPAGTGLPGQTAGQERSDSLSFDDFLADYFGTRQTTAWGCRQDDESRSRERLFMEAPGGGLA